MLITCSTLANKLIIDNLGYFYLGSCPVLAKNFKQMYFENAYGDSCNNKKNSNIKELLLFI